MAEGAARESKTSQNRLAAAEKHRQALELRRGGATFAEIAAMLGYEGPSGAYRAVMGALRRTLQEPADELRSLELSRLDALLMAVWPQATRGNLGAIDRALRIGERRAALAGLDGPQRVEQTVTASERLLAALRAFGQGDVTGDGDGDGDAATADG